jgi:hypothetical protein
MPWKKPEKIVAEIQCLPILIRLYSIDLEGNFSILCRLFGGESFIKTQLAYISQTLIDGTPENVPEHKELLKMASITLSNFSQKNKLNTETANIGTLRSFIAGSAIDLPSMMRIVSHLIFTLGIELHELEIQKKAA